MLSAAGILYSIENVETAPLLNPVTLCGQYFGLAVRRHRKIESNFIVEQPICKSFHKALPIAVYGDHPERSLRRYGTGGYINRAHNLAMGQAAMGIDWMDWRELTQSIPPAYSEFIGRQVIEKITSREASRDSDSDSSQEPGPPRT
jgi:DNA (cytosine-5)-methyltransferase 1